MAVAATASGGDTIAPRTNAAGQPRPGTIACATAATPAVVASTRPTARRVMGRRFAWKSRSDVKYAAAQRMGGRKIRKTISGSSATDGTPGTKPRISPPITRKMG